MASKFVMAFRVVPGGDGKRSAFYRRAMCTSGAGLQAGNPRRSTWLTLAEKPKWPNKKCAGPIPAKTRAHAGGHHLKNPTPEFGKRKPCIDCADARALCPRCALIARNMFAAGMPRFIRLQHADPIPDWHWKPGRAEVQP